MKQETLKTKHLNGKSSYWVDGSPGKLTDFFKKWKDTEELPHSLQRQTAEKNGQNKLTSNNDKFLMVHHRS